MPGLRCLIPQGCMRRFAPSARVLRIPRAGAGGEQAAAGVTDAAGGSSVHDASWFGCEPTAVILSKTAFADIVKWMSPAGLSSLAIKVFRSVGVFSVLFSVVVSALPVLGMALALSLSLLLLLATVAGSMIFFTCIIRSLCWLQVRLKRASPEHGRADVPPVEFAVDRRAGNSSEEEEDGLVFKGLRILGEAVAIVAGLVDVWGNELLSEAVANAAGWIDATFFDAAFFQHFDDIDRAEERMRSRLASLKTFPRVKFSQLRTSSCCETAKAVVEPAGEDGVLLSTASEQGRDFSLTAKKYALENNACPICLEDFGEDDQVCQLAPICVHFFHSRCIDPWLASGNSVCPVCRSMLFPEDDMDIPSFDMDFEPFSADEY